MEVTRVNPLIINKIIARNGNISEFITWLKKRECQVGLIAIHIVTDTCVIIIVILTIIKE